MADKYNTKDIRHIDEKSQEYIAENNRMTEEIIINGVDVTGCKHYKSETCLADYLFTDMAFSEAKCVLSPNCHYKQLKRLEQENKELKEKAPMKLIAKNTKYRSALEEIKNDLKEVCKEECDYTKPKFCGDCDCRYGQILTKINEVLK